MQTQSQPEQRFKKRVPCDLVVAGSRHPGIVLNLSRGGLFVQTSVAFQRGDWVAVDLNSQMERESIELEAVVMWNRHVAAQLRGVRHGGVGLKIRNASREYYDLLSGVSGDSGATLRGPTTPKADPNDTISTPRFDFRVRVRLREQPRSKTIILACENEGQARSRAIAHAGKGEWEILEVLRLSLSTEEN